MKIQELKIKPVNELHKLLIECRAKLQELRFKAAADQLKNVREVRVLKRSIARILMLLRNAKTEKK